MSGTCYTAWPNVHQSGNVGSSSVPGRIPAVMADEGKARESVTQERK